jgi:exosome complex component RRP40
VQHGKFVSTTALGTLHYKEPSFYWVEQAGKRYTPQTGDNVVGLVEDKMGEFYAINVFSGHTCIMNRFAFDGATKRNKPELKRGDVVYARVQSSGRDCDTELSCLVTSGAKKDWSTGEAVGQLPRMLPSSCI